MLLPKINSFGWGVKTSHKLKPSYNPSDDPDDLTVNISVHPWKNLSHTIMGPFYSGDPIALKMDDFFYGRIPPAAPIPEWLNPSVD